MIDLVARLQFLEHAADHLLVAPFLVAPGGVEVADAQFEGALDQGRVVGVHHAHGHHRDFQACPAQCAYERLGGCARPLGGLGILSLLGVQFQSRFAQ